MNTPGGLRVLGCSGAIARGCHTTAFLLDDDILIDAGSGVGELTLDDMARVDHVLLSHSHLDHVLGLPLLADSVMRRRNGNGSGPLAVYALPETLAALRRHLFNGQLWPDFTRLPSPAQPVLRLHEIGVGQTLHLGRGGRSIRVLPARHTVPAVGFAIDGGAGGWLAYSGDTAANPALWQALAGLNVTRLIIELAFSERDSATARRSGHYCPASLAADLARLDGGLDIWLTHIKPGEVGMALSELTGRLPPGRRVQALQHGQVLEVDEQKLPPAPAA